MAQPSEQSSSPEQPPARPGLIQRFKDFNERVWALDALNDRTIRGKLGALYRVITTSIQGCLRNKIPLQSAALTYYSLMSLAPLVGLALIVSGFILKREARDGDDPLKTAIVQIIHEIVPQTTVDAAFIDQGYELFGMEELKPLEDDPTVPPPEHQSLSEINTGLDKFVDNLLNKAANGGAGIVGLSIFLVLAVLMVSRIENAFNTIWNVQYGRRWKDRFVNYLVFIILAFLLGAASITMLSASSLARGLSKSQSDFAIGLSEYFEAIPGGQMLLGFLESGAPLVISIALLTVLTACLNKFMPNTRVHWLPALGGGLVAAVIIIGNQKLAALYVSKVISLQSLYGELSLVLILMFGMYLTWLFLLIGGQVTYSLQNVRYLADHRTWENIGTRSRQTLCFACLFIIARHFKNQETAPTAEDLEHSLHVPGSIIVECLRHLSEAKLISAVLDRNEKVPCIRYQPAKPLDQMTLGSVKEDMETFVGRVRLDLLEHGDPALAHYHATLRQYLDLPGSRITLDQLVK